MKNILIVSDDRFYVDNAPRLLKSLHYDVLNVFDGWKAFYDLQKKSFSLIIIDFAIKGISGPELVKMIYETPKLVHQPILIVVPVRSVKSWVYKYMGVPINGILPKPIEIKPLLNGIIDVIGKGEETVIEKKTHELVQKEEPKKPVIQSPDQPNKNTRYGDALTGSIIDAPLEPVVIGLKATKDVSHPSTGALIVPIGTVITESLYNKLSSIGISVLSVDKKSYDAKKQLQEA